MLGEELAGRLAARAAAVTETRYPDLVVPEVPADRVVQAHGADKLLFPDLVNRRVRETRVAELLPLERLDDGRVAGVAQQRRPVIAAHLHVQRPVEPAQTLLQVGSRPLVIVWQNPVPEVAVP